MKIDFSQIINKEADKSAIIMGLGPSLTKHLPNIAKLPRNKFTIISCNNVDKFTKIHPDYWVLCNSELSIKKIHNRLNKIQNTTVVYADSIDLTPRKEVDKILKVNYLPYDQRHFNGQKCGNGKCCKHIIPNRLTIQEEFKKYTNGKYETSCDTVAIPMLYLSILLGCKNIYLTGVDLNYSGGYVNNHKASAPNVKNDSLVKCQPRTLKTIKTINDVSKNVNIYCLDNNVPISKILDYSTLPVSEV